MIAQSEIGTAASLHGPAGLESPANDPAAFTAAQDDASADFLFEAPVCDLHWTMLHVGVVGQLAHACLRMQATWTLRPWRHLMNDSSPTAHLLLRYGPQLGLAPALTAGLTQFEKALSDLQARTAPLTRQTYRYEGAQWRTLSSLVRDWAELGSAGSAHLQALEPHVQRSLDPIYGEDLRMLVRFLREARTGETQRVNEWGEIALPALKQRRRSVRAPMEQACHVIVDGREIAARMTNLSVDGVGIACHHPLQAGQSLEISVGSRRLPATVAWADGTKYGLRLARRLERHDPLLSAGTGDHASRPHRM